MAKRCYLSSQKSAITDFSHVPKFASDYYSFIPSSTFLLTLALSAPTPQKCQAHSNNSSATAGELFECV